MTRTVAFGDDGKLFVAIGSSCNICVETDDRRAAIMRYDADGANGERFAWGLRNPVGLAFEPDTNTLWATVNERDNQGNEIPPDLVTIVTEGANYGWPDCQPPDATPQEPGADCTGITPPTVGIQAHSAPLGLAFSTGDQFPDAWQSGIFVVQHGSWNRQPPAEPKLIYITLDNGAPTAVTDFATGLAGPGRQPLGPSCRSRRRARWQPDRLRRHCRGALPNRLYGVIHRHTRYAGAQKTAGWSHPKPTR